MERNLVGKTALVTGAQQGIGLAIAKRLFAEGANVIIVDLDPQQISSAVNALDCSNERLIGYPADLAKTENIQQCVEHARTVFGGVDILVNNAGISPKHEGKSLSVAEVGLEEWDHVLRVNLTATFLLCQACIPSMQNKGWGRIVNMSSQAARTPSKIAGAHYSASKAGIIAFSRVLAHEVAPFGITVNCVAPGRILTPMAAEAGADENERYRQRIPVKRLGRPADVAGVVSFLISEDAEFITGTTLDINGGVFMS